MLKSFKICITAALVTASCVGAVAQAVTYKEVILDGKLARLNLVTGKVTLIDEKLVITDTIRQISTGNKLETTEIKANLLTRSSNIQKSELPSDKSLDTIIEIPIVVIMDEPKVDIPKPQPSQLSKEAEKATALVYDTSQSERDESNNTDFHLVQKGETLYSISKRYGVSLSDLKVTNNLQTTLIKTGQNLRVKHLETLQSVDVWTVSKGDTLYNISKRTNTSVNTIKALNGLQSNLIKIGQVLRLK